MTKPNAIPANLKVTREGDEFLLTVPYHWGKGATLAEARAKLRQVYGKPATEWRAWRVYSVAPDTFLDEMGMINHPKGHAPTMLAEYDPK